MKKVLVILLMIVLMTSCTDMVVTSTVPQVSTVTVVKYRYPSYVPRYPVYALPPKEYWHRPSWRAPRPPKHEPWPPRYTPNRKPSPGFGNMQRPAMRGPRTFNRDRN